MSEVKVNKISPRSGTTITLGDSGDTFTVPSGVTFDASSGGLAGTLTTAAQPNITSVGTLTSFTSTGIDDNATSTAITIDSSERVGIGETVPSLGKLVITTTQSFQPLIGLRTEVSNGEVGIQFVSDNATPGINYLNFGDSADVNSGQIAYRHNVDAMTFKTNDSERMRIDSSGNVGIGTSSPNEKLDSRGSAVFSGDHATATNAFGTSHGILISSTPNLGRITAVSNGANDVKLELRGLDGGSANSNQLVLDGGTSNVGIGTSSPSTTLDVTGNVKITTTDNSDTLKLVSTDADAERGPVLVLHRDSGSPADNDVVGELQFAADSDAASETNFALLIGKALDVSHGSESGELDIQTRLSGTGRSRIKMNSTETVVNDNSVDLDFRVESNDISNMFVVNGADSKIYINASSTISGASGYLQIQNNYTRTAIDTKSNTTAPHHAITFHNPNGQVGQINTDGSGVTFTSNSDYRLKENVNYDFDATTRLKQLKPARFNFKADTNKIVDGFIAHEVSSVVPEAIHGTKDAVDEDGNPQYQGIDQSKLVPLLVKTIQELEARITTLENA